MTLGLSSLAQKLGKSHNRSHGITPLQWLTSFGTALNLGLYDDATQPLPLHCCSAADQGALTPYPDGTACPSLQSYLHISVAEVAVLAQAAALEGLDAPFLTCRLRLLGNAMSRPPLLFELQRAEQGGECVYRLVSKGSRSSMPGAGGGALNPEYQPDNEPFLYPVHHDVSTSLLMVEVGAGRRSGGLRGWEVSRFQVGKAR